MTSNANNEPSIQCILVYFVETKIEIAFKVSYKLHYEPKVKYPLYGNNNCLK